MNKNDNLANLDQYQVLNRTFDQNNDAQRVAIVAGDALNITAKVDNQGLINCIEHNNKALMEMLQYEADQFKLRQQTEIKVEPETIIVPKIEIREIEKQVIIREPQIIEIEKRVEVPIYKTVEIPVITQQIVQIPVPIIQYEKNLDKLALIIQSLILVSLIINIFK